MKTNEPIISIQTSFIVTNDVIIKLVKNANIIKLFLIIFLVTEKLAQKKLFLNQNTKTKYLLKVKTVSRCSLTP